MKLSSVEKRKSLGSYNFQIYIYKWTKKYTQKEWKKMKTQYLIWQKSPFRFFLCERPKWACLLCHNNKKVTLAKEILHTLAMGYRFTSDFVYATCKPPYMRISRCNICKDIFLVRRLFVAKSAFYPRRNRETREVERNSELVHYAACWHFRFLQELRRKPWHSACTTIAPSATIGAIQEKFLSRNKSNAKR